MSHPSITAGRKSAYTIKSSRQAMCQALCGFSLNLSPNLFNLNKFSHFLTLTTANHTIRSNKALKRLVAISRLPLSF
jgi:hypothetical protein